MTAEILCLGEAMVEFVRLADGTYQQGFGGDTSNAAIAAARQGANVGFLTALGKDRFGDQLANLWQTEGIDVTAVRRNADAPTGIYFVDPDPAGRFFTYYRSGSAASLMQPDDLPIASIAAARCLHLSGITLAVSTDLRRTALTAVRAANSAGTLVSIDTNLRLKLWDADTARTTIEQAMTHADVAVTSIDDSIHLTGLADPAAIARHYSDLGPKIVIVTLGADGCYLVADHQATVIPADRASPVDSTGAGDSFCGSFLAWWLETADPVLSATRAAFVAARTVSGLGATAPIPGRAEVLASLR